MRILFVGSVEFSKRVLEKLLELKANVVGIITKKDGTIHADYADLSELAESYTIPILWVDDINHPNNISRIAALEPDIIFCFGWSTLLKKELLQLPRLGVVGFHPALLPSNRGRHPIVWALSLGLQITGSTFFFMDEGADTGDIIHQVKIEIELTDDARTLYDKITKAALLQVQVFLPNLINETFSRLPQPKEMTNTWRKRGQMDGLIDFRMHSQTIYHLVRALTKPYIGAHCLYKGSEVKIWKVDIIPCDLENIEPGKVIGIVDRKIEVKTADQAILLLDHDFKELPRVGDYII